jgi:hypothetical protein
VRVVPIGETDIPQVAEFLSRQLNRRLAPPDWARCIDVPWAVDAPNHGFMLVDGDATVGVHLAFYADREVAGQLERFCNLGAWCVQESHRGHSLRLLMALLRQRGYHFTDLSPSGNVVGLNERLNFRALDTTAAMALNLPLPSRSRGISVSADPERIRQTISGAALAIYRDHVDTRAARHLLITDRDQWCYVMFRKDRRKRLPLFASILYVSDPQLLRRAWRAVSRHLLMRHGAAITIAELRVVEQRPNLSVLSHDRPKMYRSATLAAADIDYLYSELVCVDW